MLLGMCACLFAIWRIPPSRRGSSLGLSDAHASFSSGLELLIFHLHLLLTPEFHRRGCFVALAIPLQTSHMRPKVYMKQQPPSVCTDELKQGEVLLVFDDLI